MHTEVQRGRHCSTRLLAPPSAAFDVRLLSPLLPSALAAFDGMRMEVQPPEVWQPRGATGGTPAAA